MPDETGEVIYRCGWCGYPTDQRGAPVPGDPAAYLGEHAGAAERLIQGECCPHGNEEEQQRAASRTMAMDAGDPNLEGW